MHWLQSTQLRELQQQLRSGLSQAISLTAFSWKMHSAFTAHKTPCALPTLQHCLKLKPLIPCFGLQASSHS